MLLQAKISSSEREALEYAYAASEDALQGLNR